MKPFNLLDRVKMTIVHDGVIQTMVGDVVGRTLVTDTAPEKQFYDVMIDGVLHPNVKPSVLEYVSPPLRVIDFPYPTGGWVWEPHFSPSLREAA